MTAGLKSPSTAAIGEAAFAAQVDRIMALAT
jgi:hypothetical protein